MKHFKKCSLTALADLDRLMDIAFYFKNLAPTEAIKTYAGKKLEKLKERLHHIEGIDVRFSLERQHQFFEVTVRGDATVFHLKKSDKDLYAAIDNALDVLNNQIEKYRKKLEGKSASMPPIPMPMIAEHPAQEEIEIAIRDAEIKPMDDHEAVLQLRTKKLRFLMYHHADKKKYGLVTVRNDGHYSIVTPAADGFVETISELEETSLRKMSEAIYPVSKFTVAEALELLQEGGLEYLAFVNEETGRLNVIFYAASGAVVIMRPAV